MNLFHYSSKLNKSFVNCLLTISVMVFNGLLISCSPDVIVQMLETQSPILATPNLIEATITPTSIETREVTPILNVTSLFSTTSITLTPTVVTGAPVTNLGTLIQQKCVTSNPIQEDEKERTNGLMWRGTWKEKEGTAIIGKDGLGQPLLFIPDTDDQIVWLFESPDKAWIAYYYQNRNENIWSIEIVVWNSHSGEEIKKTFEFENVGFLAYDATIHWANNSQLIIPLENEGELFRWLVWSPFINEVEELVIELTGIGNQMEYFRNPPVLDPLLEMAVYPCEFCNDAEYAVKNLATGETIWFIDLGTEPSYVHRSTASWSPDGRFVTIVGGKFLNQLLFFNREGEKLYEITLPLLDNPGGLMIFARTWSPDSNYLAFLRVTGSEGNYEDTLTYVDTQNWHVVDFCINARTGFPIWSSDSNKIAFSQQIESGEPPYLISIVDIHLGEVVQLNDAASHNLVGWIDPLDE